MQDVGRGEWLRPGAVLAGKYEVIRVIGRGGFGRVYEALHVGLRSRVAVKVLGDDARQRPEMIARFRQEAWTSAQIVSPNVVRVTDVDVLDDGTPFLVMELLEGRDLQAELRDRGRLPIHEAVGYVLQAASGVAHAHARGVVHRDLKPNNLFLAEEPGGRRLKVLDFGLSKVTAELSVTVTHSSLGTPLYMSPEQIRSAKYVDQRTDIWSLGVILYRLLSGHTPFNGATAADLLVAIMSQRPVELARAAPNVPPELSRVVMKALSKELESRFSSMGEFASALSMFAPPGSYFGGMPSQPPRGGVQLGYADAQRGPESTFLDSSKDTPIEPRSSRASKLVWIAAGLTLAILLGLGMGARWLAATGQPSQPSAGQTPLATTSPVAPAAAAPAAPLHAPVSAAISAPNGASAPSTSALPRPAEPVKTAPLRRARPKAPSRSKAEPNLGF